mgnify:FL=1
MQIKSFTQRTPLGNGESNIRYTNVLFDVDSKKIINFVVIQFYVDPMGEIHEIIKHDFSHGHYNVHKFYLGHTHRMENHEALLSVSIYQQAKADINQNWKDYVSQYRFRFLTNKLKEG